MVTPSNSSAEMGDCEKRSEGVPNLWDMGESTEQGKWMIKDPSGNLIEIKAYRQPDKVLGSLAHQSDIA